ncbi:MAG: ABC transporter substrate-binding protein [Flavobacteriales bacterium]
MKIYTYLYLAVIAVVISCSKQGDNQSNVFYYNESNGITSLDPAFARDLEIMWATNQLFDGLVEFNAEMELVPVIAKSWTISEDGKKYSFIINNEVTFHHSEVFGPDSTRKVTAQDFVYSFNRIVDPKVASPGAWIFSQVDFQNENGFSAPNDSTFVIHLTQPFQPFLGMLSMQYCNVVPKEAIEKYGQDFRAHPIGTGPFQFAFWYENIALVFHKNNFYFQKDENGTPLPYLDAIKIDFVKEMSVEFQGLLLNKYDFISGIHPSFKDEILTSNGELDSTFSKSITFFKTPFIKTDYIGFYIDSASEEKTAKSSALRKAIELAIDKKEMVRYLRNNTVVPANQGFIPPSLLTSQQEVNAYNLEMAKSLFEEAGVKANGQPLKIVMATTSDYTDLIEYIQHSLQKFNLDVEVQVMQGSTFRDATAKGQLPIFRKSWLADYPDPENFFSLFTSKNFCPAGPNYTHYFNTRFDSLYNEAIQIVNDSARTAVYQEMNSIIANDSPVIPIYYDQVSHFVSNRVQNWEINPINLIDLKKVKKLN